MASFKAKMLQNWIKAHKLGLHADDVLNFYVATDATQ